MFTFTNRSVITGKINTMDINTGPEKVLEWLHMPYTERPLIQDYFPELNEDEREFLLNGITPEEWDGLFEGDER